MDMYVKMYDELVRIEGHNPTIGLLLCADTDDDVAHYSVLNNNDQLFAAKYLTYMPTHHRQSIEYQRSVNLIGTWLFFESFSKVSESASA